MTRYVSSQIDPLWEHVTEHDKWHRTHLEAEVKAAKDAGRAAFRALITTLLSTAGLVVAVLSLVIHHR